MEIMKIPEHNFDESIEMYLKTIQELSVINDPVKISALADRLGVTGVSANEMIHRLQDQGFVEHIPYKGVMLAEKGLQRASSIIRSHRLWERFLVDTLGVAWEKAHDIACRMEHVASEEIVLSLAAFLNYPTTCPHGNPISYSDEIQPQSLGFPLGELKPKQGGVIRQIYPEYTPILEYLAARNLKPGVAVEVVEIGPFEGPITIFDGTQNHPLGRGIVSFIYVEKDHHSGKS